MAKQDQNSIVEPTEEELIVYKQLIQDIEEVQMDELSNEYFKEISENGLNVSFAKFIIDKLIRPIKPADTITIQTADNANMHLFCLLRSTVEGTDYLLFAEANGETGELNAETSYLFYVCGKDILGTEELDLMPAGPETERILDILEVDANVKILEIENTIDKEQKEEGSL